MRKSNRAESSSAPDRGASEAEAGGAATTGPPDRVEAARALLREEIRESSIRVVAGKVGVNFSSLATFVRDRKPVARPKGKVLEPILAYYTARTANRAESSGQAAGEAQTTTAPTGETQAGADRHDLKLESADYWRGRQDTLLEIMEHVNSLHQQALRVQREIIANTVPTPRHELTPQQRTELAKTQAALDALGRATRAQAGAEADAAPQGPRGSPSRPRRAGGSGG